MSYISSSTVRFVGMQSGIDVDTIVQSLMKAEQLKVDTISQKRTLLEWKTDAYKEVNSLVNDFADKYFSALSPAALHLSAAYNTKKVISSTDQYAVISAGSTAFSGAYTINEIKSLATGALVESSSLNTVTSTKLEDIICVPPLEFAEDKLTFNINGKDFEFSRTDTLQKVINTVNADSEAGVSMSYSSLSGKISIKSKQVGSGTDFDFQDTSGNFLSALGFTETSKGTDAVLKINNYDVVQKSNSFTIDGIKYELLRETAPDTTVNFTVSQDIDAIYNKIKGFADDYNKLIDTLNSKLSEEKYRSYLPLTDLQKEAMNEKDIEEWDKKAKSGLVSGDENLRKLLIDIRKAFSQTVEGSGILSSSIGITTGHWSEKGKIHIDETKLKEALSNNTQAVTSLFTKINMSDDANVKFSQSGIAERIKNSMKSYTSYISSKTLEYTKKQISDYTNKIKDSIDKMNKKEAYYYKQYSALEVAMSKFNSQSSYISSLLSNG